MKTTLKFLALIFTAALPVALAANLVLPAALAGTHLLGAFTATFVTLIALNDYARPARRCDHLVSLARTAPRHSHPLAA